MNSFSCNLQAKTNSDYELSIEDLQNFESEYGRIPDGAIVFGYSGWDEFWYAHDR